MPYKLEHSADLLPIDQFVEGSFSRESRTHDGLHFSVITGKLDETGQQALLSARYPRELWTKAKATKHASTLGNVDSFEAASKKNLSLPDDPSLLLLGGDAFEEQGTANVMDGGTERRVYSKDIIRIGEYVHPVFGWRLNVTHDRMEKWAKTFNAMKSAGIDVEMVKDHKLTADSVMGYLLSLKVDGDVLMGTFEVLGQKNIELVGIVRNVSAGIDREFSSGSGTNFGEAITHVAVVQQPVAGNQQGFKPIHLSRLSNYEKPSLLLDLSNPETDIMKIEQLREALGMGEELTEENAGEMLAKTLKGYRDKLAKMEAAGKSKSEPKGEKEEDDEKKAASAIPPDLAEQMAATAADRLDGLVDKGKITPAVRDKLAASLIGDTGDRNLMTMSIGTSGKTSILSSVVDALAENDPVLLGEKTKSQSMILSRQTPGDTKDNAAAIKETTDEMIDAAGGKD